MQSPVARQRVRSIKQLQEGLSLPIIPERTPSSPRTSTHSRSSRHSVPCISEAALSPEEEHLQDQIRMILRNSPTANQQPNKAHLSNSKRIRPMLPPLPSHSKKGENAFSLPYPVRRRSGSARGNLSVIIQQQQRYVQLYFASLARRREA